MVDLAVKREKIPDDITSREVLNDELYDLMTPIPSQVNDIFWNKMQESSELQIFQINPLFLPTPLNLLSTINNFCIVKTCIIANRR